MSLKIGLLRKFAPALLLIALTPAHAANFTLNVLDGPGEGFNDNTPVAPVTGNPGTTLGQQRINVFDAATDFWGDLLDSDINIVVNAEFNPLTCTSTSALLGSAGPRTIHRNFTNAPKINTWYSGALANSLAGSDLSTANDIGTTFNSNLDLGSASCLGGAGWDYSIGVNTGSSLELFQTVLHELAHGLGFLTFVDISNGAKLSGFDDAFMAFLEDRTTGKTWPTMTNTERAASAVNTSNLVWNGPGVITEATGYLTNGLRPEGVRMYAPNPLQPGSSVSHWDTALAPNELMEPSATANSDSILSIEAFYEMGWQPPQPPMNPQVEVDLVSSCLAGNGRVDINIVNTQTASSVYRMEFQGLTARQTSVAFEDWARFRVTGRPPGSYTVVIKRDGVQVLSETFAIDCSVAVPPVSSPEITIVNACRSGLGQVFFQFVNPASSSRPYVIEFENVPNRSTTAAAFGQARRGTTGRPDGTYDYLIRTGGTVLEADQVTVACD